MSGRDSSICRENHDIPGGKTQIHPFLPLRRAEKRRSIRYNAELGFSSMGRSFLSAPHGAVEAQHAATSIPNPRSPFHYRR
jgi:hypothetical protein